MVESLFSITASASATVARAPKTSRRMSRPILFCVSTSSLRSLSALRSAAP